MYPRPLLRAEGEAMTGWNLPPGCTQADIDRAYGHSDPECEACGKQTDDLEREIVHGRSRLLCGKCVAGWERHCEDKLERAKEKR